MATLEPTRFGPAGAALDTSFVVRSLDGTPATALARRLQIEPALALSTTSQSADRVTLRPATRLQPGTLYRFVLREPNGAVAGAWAIQAAKPLRVVGTLPANETAAVPVDTGIEVTVDQAGVTTTDFARFFTISPSAHGRFEDHGRTIAFVPDALKPLTIYTVTVRHGLPLPGTGQSLAQDVVIRFETAARNAGTGSRLAIPTKLADSSTRERAALGIAFTDSAGDDPVVPRELAIRVHRLAGLGAAEVAYDRLALAPDWATTGGAPLATAGLSEMLRASVAVMPFRNDSSAAWIQLPRTLPAGWYVITATYRGARQQALLQVTDLAAYAQTTTTRTLVWVNDLRSGGPVAGASVTLGGTSLGRTASDGLRTAPTPAAARAVSTDSRPLLVVVRDRLGRALFVPVSRRSACECDLDRTAERAWWRILELDRSIYRPTDQVNAWGMVRERDGGAVPRQIELRLLASAPEGAVTTPISIARPEATAAGVFSASLSFHDLPPGDYHLELRAAGALVADEYVQVGPIVKPAYRISVATDVLAVIAGHKVTVSGKATFFDGTPVAGASLAIQQGGSDQTRATTNDEGTFVATITAALDDDASTQWRVDQITVVPTAPEEAAIVGSTDIAVFRGDTIVDSDASLSGHRLTVTGAVRAVAFARYSGLAVGTSISDIDPHGAPRAGALVRVYVEEVAPIRTRVGTAYNFITKRTEPVYEYDQRRVDLGTRTVRTRRDGTYALAETVVGGDRSYDVTASTVDGAGRLMSAGAYAQSTSLAEPDAFARLMTPGTTHEEGEYSVGQTVRLDFVSGTPRTGHDRYLFAVEQRGLRSAVTSDHPRFETRFTAASVPNIWINAVRFTGKAYEVVSGPFVASFRATDRSLKVSVSADRARYAPGDKATLSIRVTDRAGRPAAASVVVRAIDAKLYASGAAASADPLWMLYESVDIGVIATAWSHATIDHDRDGRGDASGGGGGDRGDFRDWLLFKTVTTGQDGRATVSFALADDITTWRVSAAAIDRSLRAGNGSTDLPSGLPFFVEATLASEYLVADRPIVRVRAFGSSLSEADRVTFTISSASLGLAETSIQGTAFLASEIALPALSAGDHQIRIAASVGSGSNRRSDVLVRTIHVTPTRALQGHTQAWALGSGRSIRGGSAGFTTIVLADAGRGRVLPALSELAANDPARADQAIASALARSVLVDDFGFDASTLRAPDADLSRFQVPDGGIALLPYASADLDLTVLAAIAGDNRLNAFRMRPMLATIAGDSGEQTERRLAALAGLAALGEPVLDAIHAASGGDLTVAEQTWLAIAALEAGDETLARQVERDLLGAHGERLGPWVRLKASDADAAAVTTARLAIVAASLGDPLAADMDAYVVANPPRDTTVELERAIAARGWALRIVGEVAAVRVTVDGATSERRIEPDAPVRLVLTPAQVADLRIEPLSGTVLAVSTWDAPLQPASLAPAPGQKFTRSVSPTGRIASDALVEVVLKVTLGPQADKDCWRVTDLVPSGLAPLAAESGWPDDPEVSAPDVITPWRIVGQRVDFCVSPRADRPEQELRYVARVVTPGTYRWEPAVLQSSIVTERGLALERFDVTIDGRR